MPVAVPDFSQSYAEIRHGILGEGGGGGGGLIFGLRIFLGFDFGPNLIIPVT